MLSHRQWRIIHLRGNRVDGSASAGGGDEGETESTNGAKCESAKGQDAGRKEPGEGSTLCYTSKVIARMETGSG
jgi:hypothetical protein